jgi:hypothetical protein
VSVRGCTDATYGSYSTFSPSNIVRIILAFFSSVHLISCSHCMVGYRVTSELSLLTFLLSTLLCFVLIIIVIIYLYLFLLFSVISPLSFLLLLLILLLHSCSLHPRSHPPSSFPPSLHPRSHPPSSLTPSLHPRSHPPSSFHPSLHPRSHPPSSFHPPHPPPSLTPTPLSVALRLIVTGKNPDVQRKYVISQESVFEEVCTCRHCFSLL